MRELRIKGVLMDHKEIRASMGVKIVAPGLESAVAGTSMYVVRPDDDEEELKDAMGGRGGSGCVCGGVGVCVVQPEAKEEEDLNSEGCGMLNKEDEVAN